MHFSTDALVKNIETLTKRILYQLIQASIHTFANSSTHECMHLYLHEITVTRTHKLMRLLIHELKISFDMTHLIMKLFKILKESKSLHIDWKLISNMIRSYLRMRNQMFHSRRSFLHFIGVYFEFYILFHHGKINLDKWLRFFLFFSTSSNNNDPSFIL